jgi:hypothetical protein
VNGVAACRLLQQVDEGPDVEEIDAGVAVAIDAARVMVATVVRVLADRRAFPAARARLALEKRTSGPLIAGPQDYFS